MDQLLEQYAAKPRDENPAFADVDIEIAPAILEKIHRKHDLTEDDVVDIVKGRPPAVVEAPHPDDGEKRQFWLHAPRPRRFRRRCVGSAKARGTTNSDRVSSRLRRLHQQQGASMNKKLSEMTDAELAAASDEVELEARDRSRWTETEESKSKEPEREAWLDDNTTAISIRMPNALLEVLRAVAASENMGYQTLIKKWLHRDVLALAKSRGAKKRETLVRSLQGEGEQKEQLMASLAPVLLRRG